MKGGCHWDYPDGPCTANERNAEIGVSLAGPIGQVLHASSSLGAFATAFNSTIFQSDDVLTKAGCAGWASTDLKFYLKRRDAGKPNDVFTQIEGPIRSLLAKRSVAEAIRALAEELKNCKEVDGKDAESLIQKHLEASDYVGNAYV